MSNKKGLNIFIVVISKEAFFSYDTNYICEDNRVQFYIVSVTQKEDLFFAWWD